MESQVALLDDLEREHCCVQKISQFVGENSDLLIERLELFVRHFEITLIGELGDGHGDGVIQTAV